MTDDTSNHETQTYDGHIIINWRDDKVRYRKTEPDGNLSPSELAIPLSIDVTVPEVQVPEIHADVEVPPARVERTVTGGAAFRDDTEGDDA